MSQEALNYGCTSVYSDRQTTLVVPLALGTTLHSCCTLFLYLLSNSINSTPSVRWRADAVESSMTPRPVETESPAPAISKFSHGASEDPTSEDPA